eukprot:Gb_01885 [translate_table: standard]
MSMAAPDLPRSISLLVNGLLLANPLHFFYLFVIMMDITFCSDRILICDH